MMSGNAQASDGRGILAGSISSAIVALLHRYTGRGPIRARTTIDEDLIVCVLAATLTRGEELLVERGRHEVVLSARRAFQETMRDEAVETVERLTGRHVLAFMSTNHLTPDMAVEVFVLAPLGQDSPASAPEPQRAEGRASA
jgi:uncharacterized protein YbcI